MTPRIILIHPPIVKCSEPPAGIARLSACLTENNIAHEVVDANLEGILFLLRAETDKNVATDRWTARARKNIESNLSVIKNIATYRNQSRYQTTVMDINHLLNAAGKSLHIELSLADYQDKQLSPVKSGDLLTAAEKPQTNPFYPYFQSRLGIVLNKNPEFIGFSINYLSQALCAFAMIGFIKRMQPSQKIILGGSLMTSWMKLGVNKNSFGCLADEIVDGAGENKLLEICNIEGGSNNSPPAYHNFQWDQYFSPGRVLPYSSARGCYWHKCVFCPETAEGNAYLSLDISRVTNDVRKLTKQSNPTLIHILDSSISPLTLTALSQNPPGAPWYGFTRVTQDLADEDFCLAMKRSGCVMLKLGLESGDQNVLDKLNKGIDLAVASAALKTLKKTGIATYCYFLFGTPPENEESAVKTMDFVAMHHEDIDFLNMAIFNLPARSVEAQELATHDFYEGDLSLYRNFKHPLGWQRQTVRHFLEKTFKKHPVISPIIKRTPEFFTSNHAPFFAMNHNGRD